MRVLNHSAQSSLRDAFEAGVRRCRAFTALLSVGALACGGAERPPTAPPPALPSPGRAPSTTLAGIALPPFPEGVAADQAPLLSGWLAARQALTRALPHPPPGPLAEVEVWAAETLAPFLSARAQELRKTHRALEPARRGTREQSVVASAVLGTVYLRAALELRGMPAPQSLARRPADADAYRAALDAAARPLAQRAVDAFGSCASTAARAPVHVLSRWRRHCDDERRLAEAVGAERSDPSR